jgi:hypothetical protein
MSESNSDDVKFDSKPSYFQIQPLWNYPACLRMWKAWTLSPPWQHGQNKSISALIYKKYYGICSIKIGRRKCIWL